MHTKPDSNGNRLTKAVSGGQSSTETYTYAATNGWKDQLTGYNGVGLTYDASGNPLRYYGYVMSWENGRQLSGFTGGISPVSYEYNDSGIRTKKTVGSTVTEYFVEGGLLLGQKTGSNVMQFLYEGGSIYGFLYNGTPYYYVYNGQGDVVSVLNGTGTTVATYLYDAWGNLTSSSGSMADTNPIRYRGYYYDIESGFYYLQSRYYDPKTGRFINADGQINADMSGTNLYAYCGSNPVNFADPTGRIAVVDDLLAALLIGVAAGAVAGAVAAGAAANSPTVQKGMDGLWQSIQNTFRSISDAFSRAFSNTQANTKTSNSNNNNTTTYYHATSLVNASKIMATSTITAGEGGYVYAWKHQPSQQAVMHSGARYAGRGNVIIAFDSSASFVSDNTIDKRFTFAYDPVRTLIPGDLKVKNVRIVWYF